MARHECEVSIKKTGEVVGRCTLEYETIHDGAGFGDSEGQLLGLDFNLAWKFADESSRLILRRVVDGRTAEVAIITPITPDAATVLFDHAPFVSSEAR